MEGQQQSPQPTRKVGVRTILGWAFGLLSMFSGAFLLLSNPIQGIVNALAGLSVFPPFWNFVKQKWNFELSGMLKLILFIVLFGISMGIAAGDSSSPSSSTTTQDNKQQQAQSEKPQETVYKVNQTVSSKNMELTVTQVEERDEVGGQYFKEEASEGGTLVAVQWQYKNTSEKPIGMLFSGPSIKLVDANGVEYDNDTGKSSAFATEVDLDAKILSDLNPGITVKDADVFEISKEAFAKGGWFVQVRADGGRYKVAIN